MSEVSSLIKISYDRQIPNLVGDCSRNETIRCGGFRGFELVYFAVKTLKHGTSAKHLKKEIIAFWQEIQEFYNPSIMALKEINQYQQTSATLLLIADSLKTQAEKSQVLLFEISLAQIRLLVNGGNRKSTQKRVFQRIAALYPELQQYENRPSKGQKDYYAYIFSSVAVGLVCLNDLAQKKKNLKF